MPSFRGWDAATWQAWVGAHWETIALVAAGLVLLMAMLTIAARPITRVRRGEQGRQGEFVGAMPPASLEGVPADRRADILRAIDDDYASGLIDRVEWERRRRGR